MPATRRDLSRDERNAIYDATGGGEAYCVAADRAELDGFDHYADWLMQQAMTEAEPLDLTDEAHSAHQAAVLSRHGLTEPPF